MKQTTKSILIAAVVGSTSGMAGAWLAGSPEPAPVAATPAPVVTVQNRGPAAGASFDFATASTVATPSVVFIKTVSSMQPMSYFDWFFGGGGGNQRQIGSGSGVIFSEDGFIVTNNHVIENAENIEVVHEKRVYQASVVGTDPSSDLAVLKIKSSTKLPAIRLADSRQVQVGEWVLAVGNPFNLNSTVTAGIVSAKGRNLNILNSQFPIESFIQTDAAINPGNSGGALVNLQGLLIGINTAIYSQTGSYTGYGFAVPSDIVAKVVNDIIKYGEVQKVYIGAEVVDVSNQIAQELKTDDYSGVYVYGTVPGGSADKAGLQKGDVILKIDNQTINSKALFDEEISYRNPGDKITITYRRGKEQRTTTVTLTNREGTTELLRREIFNSRYLGAQLESISKVERERYKVAGGVRVVKYTRSNGLAIYNLPEDCIWTAINGQAVRSPEDLERMIKETPRGARLVVEVINNQGQKLFYNFRMS